jgi:hypothetical protein
LLRRQLFLEMCQAEAPETVHGAVGFGILDVGLWKGQQTNFNVFGRP